MQSYDKLSNIPGTFFICLVGIFVLVSIYADFDNDSDSHYYSTVVRASTEH